MPRYTHFQPINVPQDVYKRLRRYAAKESLAQDTRITMSSILTIALIQYLDAQEGPATEKLQQQ